MLFSSRAEKATAYATQCLAMLTEISMGYSFYHTAKLLHESIFVNGTITNMETWPDFSTERISMFERAQQYFLRRVTMVAMCRDSDGSGDRGRDSGNCSGSEGSNDCGSRSNDHSTLIRVLDDADLTHRP